MSIAPKYTGNIMLLLLLLITASQALAQLSVSPKRVIFEGRERSQELLLLNTGASSKKYRIHFRQLKMTTQGGYEEIGISDQHSPLFASPLFASQAVRYSPRQVTLTPGMAQTIRLLVRKPKGFAPGEYRSHLTFSEIPSDDLGTSIEDNATDQGFDFKIVPLLGMSIPIIIRQGKLNRAVEIKNPVLATVKAKQQLNLELHRSGQASVYGQIIATFTAKGSQQAIEIGKIKGVSVLTPLSWRTVVIPLANIPKELRLSQGKLHIRYTNLEQKADKNNRLLSEYTLAL